MLRNWQTALWVHRWPLLVLLAIWGALNAWLQIHALQFRPDGIWAGHLNIWSDWPMHAGMAIGFADRPPAQWLDHHPLFANGALVYPFGVNLASGLLLRAGLSLDWALTLPTLLAAVLTPVLLYVLFFHLLATRRGAVLAVFLFYLGAGLGGWEFLLDAFERQDWAALAYPPLEVSRLDEYDWYSGNVLTGMLLPQRAFVFGLPFALLSLIGLLRGLEGSRAGIVLGGLLAGLLPLLHTHSFMALALIGLAVAICSPGEWRRWLPYAVIAGGLAGLIVWLLFPGIVDLPQHLRWAPGFAADGNWRDWMQMWWRLWGLTLPVVILGVVFCASDPRLRVPLVAGLLCFAFANLVLVQPNRWDNAKIFLWAWLCWIPVCALAIGVISRWPLGRLLSSLLIIGLTLTGACEVWRLVHVEQGGVRISSRAEFDLAQRLRLSTPADAVFATEPSHNHPVMAWAGRPILLGFTGWIDNLGYSWQERERALQQIYAGGPGAQRLLQRHGVDYVYVGAGERGRYRVNEAWFSRHGRLAYQAPGIRIYAVSARSG